MRVIILTLMVMLLTGCSGIQFAEQKAGQLSDQIVLSGEASTCDRPTVASIMRTHCKTKEGCQRWINFCFVDGSPLKAQWERAVE